MSLQQPSDDLPDPVTPAAVTIPAGPATLLADLAIPHHPRGAVLFAHGSGSSRHSPRNQYVAAVLQQAGLATLLLDLLTEQEETLDQRTASLRFDIPFLTRRLHAAATWLLRQPGMAPLKLGCFGASTGAAAALELAAAMPQIAAVVSRGGRVDLAEPALARVQAPVLLIVGQRDPVVLELNRAAMAHLPSETKLEIIPAATHLFEEPGALEQVAQLATDWFEHHLAPGKATTSTAA